MTELAGRGTNFASHSVTMNTGGWIDEKKIRKNCRISLISHPENREMEKIQNFNFVRNDVDVSRTKVKRVLLFQKSWRV